MEGVVQGIISFIGMVAPNVVRNTDGIKVNWSEVFKFTSDSSDDLLKEVFGKYSDVSSLGKGVATACNWSVAIIGSGVANAEEFGDTWYKNPQFYFETGVESLLNVGEVMLVQAGVKATAGLATTGSIHAAVAAGAATAALPIAIDYIGDSIATKVSNGTKTRVWKDALADVAWDAELKWLDILKKGYEFQNNVQKDIAKSAYEVISNKLGDLCRRGEVSFS